MKTREIKELRNKPVSELLDMLRASEERLRILRFDLVQGKVKNVSQIRTLRKDIARILTVLNLHKHER